MSVKRCWKIQLAILAAACCMLLPQTCPADTSGTSGSARNIPEEEKEPVHLTEEAENCLESLDLIITPVSDDASKDPEIETLGNWTLSPHHEKKLLELLDETEKSGFHVGIVMVDIHSGKGISVHGKQEFYSASSIKGPFVISLAALYPESMETKMDTFRTIAVNSDNTAYSGLVRQFGREYYNAWSEAAGADAPLNMGEYASVSAEDLARLWVLNYEFITTSRKNGKQVGTLFEKPSRSAIRPVTEGRYKTQTKAGWIGEPRINAAADAGIIYAGRLPFVLAITSDYTGALEKLEPYVELMDEIHAEMTGTKIRSLRQK